MQDETNTPQEEEEVEGHHRPRSGPEEEAGRRIGREEGDEDEDVEAHMSRRAASPEEPGKHF